MIQSDMTMRNSIYKRYDFKAIGQAINADREHKEITREQLAGQLDLVSRTSKRMAAAIRRSALYACHGGCTHPLHPDKYYLQINVLTKSCKVL